MSKVLKVIVIILGVIVGIVLIGWAVWSWFYGQALPKTSGTLKVDGLDQPVDIIRDEYGVPHIYAHTTEDLYFAMGFVHAQDRFWEMEFQRRVASGRLSEIFGETTLETDRYLRQFGFHDSAEKSYEMFDPESKQIMESYSAGVNAYIKDRAPAKLGLEFAFLGLQGVDVKIEPWSPVDSLAWGYIMVFDQSDKMSTELTNIGQLAAVGESLYADLHPAYRGDRPTIVQPEDFTPPAKPTTALNLEFTQSELGYLSALAGGQLVDGLNPPVLAFSGFGQPGGSNSFAISGSKSATGKPILGNDPHMAVSMPSIWYQIDLRCVEKSPACLHEIGGFSLPGTPAVLIGHNDRIAWGLTNAYFDAEDVFLERLNPANPNQYEVNGKWVDMTLRREEIIVQGQTEPVVIYVRSTRNGVVGSDVITDQQPFSYGDKGPQPYALSYAWTGLQPIQTLRAVIQFNHAQNWDEFVTALKDFDTGKQNLMYADVDGNIGYVLPGKIPIRGKGDGTLPVPGWTDEYRWKGFIPYDELPRVLNPKQGFITAPNNPQVREENYPYLLGKDYDRGQRAARISSLIQKDTDGLTMAELQVIQTDNQTIAGMEFIPYLKDLAFDDSNVAAARDSLLDWDGQMLIDSPQAALYAFFWKGLIAETFNDQLPEGLRPEGETVTEDIIYTLLQNPDNDWWDQLATPDVKERRDAILKTAFEKAYAEGVDLLGDKFTDWKWGDLHTITFQNATLGKSGISLIENLFNRGPFPTNGSTTTVQKTCWTVDNFAVQCIPALRQLIDLGDVSKSLLIFTPGQSGHPKSPHYDDFIELWRNFEYIPANWLRSEAEARPHDTLVLKP